jgi:hypothetical protein
VETGAQRMAVDAGRDTRLIQRQRCELRWRRVVDLGRVLPRGYGAAAARCLLRAEGAVRVEVRKNMSHPPCQGS